MTQKNNYLRSGKLVVVSSFNSLSLMKKHVKSIQSLLFLHKSMLKDMLEITVYYIYIIAALIIGIMMIVLGCKIVMGTSSPTEMITFLGTAVGITHYMKK